MSSRPSRAPTAAHAFRSATGGPVALAALAAVGLTVLPGGDARELSAVSASQLDTDGDGLVDLQEEILGTYIDREDTDEDGFTDLEELARGSDPTDRTIVPGTQSLSVGMTARSEDGVVTMVAPIYGQRGTFATLELEIGVVLPGGFQYALQPATYLPAARASVFSALDPDHVLILLELPFPQSIVQGLGSLSLYSTVENPAAGQGASAATADLVDISGVTVLAQKTANAFPGSGPGVLYAPLVPDEEIPSSWSSGQICWQQASPAGMVGSSTAYEVTSAACQSSDTYCSSTDCTATKGKNVYLTDPTTLLGG